MAPSPLRSKGLHHGRSLSLPSATNPSISRFDENLSRVRSSSDATCTSLSSINCRISSLRNLYNNIDDLILQTHNQHIVSEKCVDRILDDYVRLLDGCNKVKDLISLAKQDLRSLISSLRRKDVNGINSYLTSRRKLKKMIQKTLKNMGSCRSNDTALSSLEKVSEKTTLVCTLKDAESVAFCMMEKLLSYTMGQERKNGWSLVSKLIHSKKSEETFFNEFEKVDSFLQLNQENEELLNQSKETESSIQVVEEELEFFYRQLIKTRVSLLNILNQ